MKYKPSYGYYGTAQARITTGNRLLAWLQKMWLLANGFKVVDKFAEEDRTGCSHCKAEERQEGE